VHGLAAQLPAGTMLVVETGKTDPRKHTYCKKAT